MSELAAILDELAHVPDPIDSKEVSEPHTQPGDLLIIHSASGCSMQLLAQAKVAVSNGVKVANTVIKIAAQSKVSQTASLQPMGSLFEQMSLLLFDAISLKLMKITGTNETSLRKNHADIE